MISNIHNSIINTIKYYNIFDMPLTIDEIYYLQESIDNKKKLSKEEIINYLKLSTEIDKLDEFYFLKGRQQLVNKRKEKENNAKKAWQFLQLHINDFLKIPFLEAVFASGSLSINYMSKNSDLDIFIIAKKNRIFTVRFFLYIIFKIKKNLWLEEGENKMKFCFNHFITDDNLKMSDIVHIYEARLYSQFFPLIDYNNIFNKFVEINKSSIKKFLPLYPDLINIWHQKIKFKTIKEKQKIFLEKILSGFLGDIFEFIVKKIQMFVFNKKAKKSKDIQNLIKLGFIQLNNKTIRFHTHPIRFVVDKKMKI